MAWNDTLVIMNGIFIFIIYQWHEINLENEGHIAFLKLFIEIILFLAVLVIKNYRYWVFVGVPYSHAQVLQST